MIIERKSKPRTTTVICRPHLEDTTMLHYEITYRQCGEAWQVLGHYDNLALAKQMVSLLTQHQIDTTAWLDIRITRIMIRKEASC